MRNCIRDGVHINPSIRNELPQGERIPTANVAHSYRSSGPSSYDGYSSSYGDDSRTMVVRAQFAATAAPAVEAPTQWPRLAGFQQTGVPAPTPAVSAGNAALLPSQLTASGGDVLLVPMRWHQHKHLIDQWAATAPSSPPQPVDPAVLPCLSHLHRPPVLHRPCR